MTGQPRRRSAEERAAHQGWLAQLQVSDDPVLLMAGARSPARAARLAVATNPAATGEILALLGQDRHEEIRAAAVAHPACPANVAITGLGLRRPPAGLPDRFDAARITQLLASSVPRERRAALKTLAGRYGPGIVIGAYWVGNATLRADATWMLVGVVRELDEPLVRTLVTDPQITARQRRDVMVELMARGGPAALDPYATDPNPAVQQARLRIVTDALG